MDISMDIHIHGKPGYVTVKPCPHCRRKVRLSPKTATVALFCDSTVALFCDSVDSMHPSNTVDPKTLTSCFLNLNRGHTFQGRVKPPTFDKYSYVVNY